MRCLKMQGWCHPKCFKIWDLELVTVLNFQDFLSDEGKTIDQRDTAAPANARCV